VRLNPLRYIDPSGNYCEETSGGNLLCSEDDDSRGYWVDTGEYCRGNPYDPVCHGVDQDNNEGDNALDELVDNYELGWHNVETAWTILTDPNATNEQKSQALAYIQLWLGAHGVLAIGGIIILREGVIVVGTQLATKNPNGTSVVIGNYLSAENNYIGEALKKGSTYFDLGKAYKVLDLFGLADPMNARFIENQISQLKTIWQWDSPKPGSGLEMEILIIRASNMYQELVGSGVFQTLFTPSILEGGN
jgi:hypothetical protein